MAIPSEALKQREREYHAEYAKRNPEKFAQAQARFREKHKDRLSQQTKQRRIDLIASMTDEEVKAFRVAESAKRLVFFNRLKDKVYAAYGGYECKCCGVTEKSFLSIDHMNNDGATHRKEIGKTPSFLYSYLVRNSFPPGFQVLCMNCQVGKHRNGGVCPHQGTCND